jgi:hypothetical protein
VPDQPAGDRLRSQPRVRTVIRAHGPGMLQSEAAANGGRRGSQASSA